MKSRFLLASFFVLSIALPAPFALARSFSVTATADANGNGESHTNPTSASAMGNYYNSAFSGDPTYPNVSSANVSVTGQQGLITGSAGSSTYDTAFSHASAIANWTDGADGNFLFADARRSCGDHAVRFLSGDHI